MLQMVVSVRSLTRSRQISSLNYLVQSASCNFDIHTVSLAHILRYLLTLAIKHQDLTEVVQSVRFYLEGAIC